MPEADINFFHERHLLPKEDIITSAECIITGNPFHGSLILTNKRLVFVRKEKPGAAFQSLRLSTVEAVDYHIENGMNFIMTVVKPEFQEEFQVLAMDNANQTEFLKLVQLQVERRKLLDNDLKDDTNLESNQKLSV